LRFIPVPAPRASELQDLLQVIAERIGRSLERSELITRDIENCYLAFDASEGAANVTSSSIWFGMSHGRRSLPSGSA